MTSRLGDVTWADLWNLAPRPIIAIPVGSCEQHGPHLPLDTDTRIVVAVAEGLVSSYEPGDVLIGPTLAVTSAASTPGFPARCRSAAHVVEQTIVEARPECRLVGGRCVGQRSRWQCPTRATRSQQAPRQGRRVLAWWPTFATAMATPANPRPR